MAYRLNRGPKIIAACLGAGALFAGARYAVKHDLLTPPAALSKVPEKANLPVLGESEPLAPDPTLTLPGREPGCSGHSELRALVWAWNAQMGLMFANGGPQATRGSLMCEHGVNLKLVRQDDAEQMKPSS